MPKPHAYAEGSVEFKTGTALHTISIVYWQATSER
jgi:hypothetical protein